MASSVLLFLLRQLHPMWMLAKSLATGLVQGCLACLLLLSLPMMLIRHLQIQTRLHSLLVLCVQIPPRLYLTRL